MATTYKRLNTELVIVNMNDWRFPISKTETAVYKGFGLFDLESFQFVSFDGLEPYTLKLKSTMVKVAKTIAEIPGYLTDKNYHPVNG